MTEAPTAPEADDEAHEPTDAEVEAWLRTREGQASMQAVMKQVVAGEFGEVPEEMLEMARQGLKRLVGSIVSSRPVPRLNRVIGKE